MRLHSSPASASKSEVSVLAIAETIAASGLAVYVTAISGHTWIFFVCVFSPLSLLRTRHSTALSLGLFRRFQQVLMPSWATTLLPTTAAAAVSIRVVSILVSLARHPIRTLSAAPRNWVRVCFCVDMTHPPEIVPGIETSTIVTPYRFSNVMNVLRQTAPTTGQHLPLIRLASTIASIRSHQGHFKLRSLQSPRGWRLPCCALLFAACLGIIYGPALLYRLSIKMMTVVYIPLLLVTGQPRNLRAQIYAIRRSDLGILRLGYALVAVLALGVIPVIAYSLYINVVTTVSSVAPEPIVAHLAPTGGSFELWHFARVVAGVFTIAAFLAAGAVPQNWSIGHRDSAPKRLASRALWTMDFVRGCLSLYVWICGIYVVSKLVQLPQLGSRLFPWGDSH